MKKIYSILAIATMILGGCSALDENPTTSLSEPSIFSTPTGLESLMTGAYNGLKLTDMWGGRLCEYLQEGSLLVHWKGYRTQSGFQQCLDLTMYSTDQYNQQCFTSTYAAINRCNNIIDHLPDSPVDEDYKLEIEGEAKLIRAVLYYYAVRMWGDVPLVITSPQSLEEANMPRTSYLKVYKQILDDLSFAEQHMRDYDRQREVNLDKSRPCRWAATAYKAAVYLQIGCILWDPDNQPFRDKPDFTDCGIPDINKAWSLALETAEKVIKEGPYDLAPKYTDLFRWTDPEDFQLKERIFMITSSNVSGGGTTSYPQYTLPEFPEGSKNSAAKASNYGRVRPERWVFQKWCREYGGTLMTDRSDLLTNVYSNCPDPRFDATYFYGSYLNISTGKKVNIYPSSGCVAGCDANNSTWQKSQAPYFKKWLSPEYDANNGTADMYLLRFAEMYLCAAEAAAELSTAVGDENWNKALGYIEELHARARATRNGATQPKWEEGRFSTKTDLVNAIFWERVYEMSGELHEWFDMRRRGAQWVIDNITTPFNAFLAEPEQGRSLTDPQDGISYFETSYFSRVFPTTIEPIKKGLLCAFPENEILTNSAIGYEDQNPYYFR